MSKKKLNFFQNFFMRNVDQKIGIFINEQSMDINKIYDNIYIYSNI